MDFKHIDFYYFSGTGNTLLVVKKMAAIFENAGSDVQLYPIKETRPDQISPEHIIGLAFPVAVQGTYPFVWDFIRGLPASEGTPVFMVDTLAYFSGGIVGPVKTILERKGYTPLGAREILMPNNLFPKASDAPQNEQITMKGLERAEQHARDLLEGRGRWGRTPVLSDLMALFSQKEWTWKLLRKGYQLEVDDSQCSQCGLCVKLCPVNNIVMAPYPTYQHQCVMCMRCIAFCPKQAIHAPKIHFSSSKPYSLYRAVKAADLLQHQDQSP